MKVGNTFNAVITFFVVAFPRVISAGFQGTKEEFLKHILAGKVPDGILEHQLPVSRRLGYGDPQPVGKRCGNNNPCVDGLDCTNTTFGGICTPVNCLMDTVNAFIAKYKLETYPETIMRKTGFYGEEVINRTATDDEGIDLLTTARLAGELLSNDFRRELSSAMLANQPNMTELLNEVQTQCPQAATKSGVVVMLGFHYELAAVLPKMFNNYYFAIGSGDLTPVVDATVDDNQNVDINFKIDGKGGVFTDLCFGVGPDVGFDLGLTAGILLSGTIDDVSCF
jgi:hypothetical protein